MAAALEEARLALQTGDVPVGATIVDASGAVVAAGRNAREALQDPTAHAEVLALRAAAAARGSWRLTGLTLVVTLEPCTMCAGAAVLARVDRIVLRRGRSEGRRGGVAVGCRTRSPAELASGGCRGRRASRSAPHCLLISSPIARPR